MTKYEQELIASLTEVRQHLNGEKELKTCTITFHDAPVYSSDEVKAIRIKAGLTQARFAKLLEVSTKTVEAWEKGINSPNGPSRRLLSLLNYDHTLLSLLIMTI